MTCFCCDLCDAHCLCIGPRCAECGDCERSDDPCACTADCEYNCPDQKKFAHHKKVTCRYRGNYACVVCGFPGALKLTGYDRCEGTFESREANEERRQELRMTHRHCYQNARGFYSGYRHGLDYWVCGAPVTTTLHRWKRSRAGLFLLDIPLCTTHYAQTNVGLAHEQALRGSTRAPSPRAPSLRPHRVHSNNEPLYFIQGRDGGHIKIGRSTNPLKRLSSLQTATTIPLVILATTTGNEQELHRRFSEHRERGEWFRDHPALREFINACDPWR